MAAAVEANRSNQAVQAAAASDDSSDNAIAEAKLPVLDPQLLMAARRGDSKRIKELLRLNTEEVESHGNAGVVVVESAAASAGHAVILEVAPPADPAAPPSLPADGVTLEGDTLLHVVAECGDGDDFIDCAKMIVGGKKRKGGAEAVRLALEAPNNKGDTPLHCAAGAGNAHMISNLVALAADADDVGTSNAVPELEPSSPTSCSRSDSACATSDRGRKLSASSLSNTHSALFLLSAGRAIETGMWRMN